MPYAVTFDVSGDTSVRGAITDASNLESLRRTPPSGAAGLVRRALADQNRIVAALYSEGYYGGTLTITVAGRAPDAPDVFSAIDAARASGPVPVVVRVTSGPRFSFGTIRILDMSGRPLPDPPRPRQLHLVPGEPARASRVLGAEDVIVDRLRDAGHPFARIASKDVVADHANDTLNVTFRVDPGPVATFGPFTVSGTETLEPGFVAARIDIRPGEPFSPERLTALRRRLAGYEIIGSVRFIEARQLNALGQLPIEVQVSERKQRYVGFAATYSNTDGSSANAFWGHRNLFGGGETLRLDAQATWFTEASDAVPDADPFGYNVSATFMKPGIFTANEDLVAKAAVLREVTNAYVRDAVTFLGGVRHRFNNDLTMQVGIDLEASKVEDSTGTADYPIVGVPVDVNFDNTDSLLDASRGVRASATVEPFAYFGNDGAGPVLMKGSISTYHAFDEDKRFILAGRVAAGSIVGATYSDAPPQRLFYVGGGGTLRGYEYQAASPRNDLGIIVGGLSFFTGSLEARLRVTDTIGIVPFFDVGAAFASEWPDFSGLQYAYGIGLRYYTAIGPLRIDVAFPGNPDIAGTNYGIYVSLGQSF
ncbi:autotransporter assembly complex protein TamA [Aquabacter spiritensis]|uniref:autotransporter assembly complex protein TamA n=1 Tax=Aquabacter spiritensis TaxID=933073 RepID=UPI001FE13C1F|nr:autotransporter assembly complex family protein [Aquabacter spiritensis]